MKNIYMKNDYLALHYHIHGNVALSRQINRE